MDESLASVLSRLTSPINASVRDQAEQLTQIWTASERVEFRVCVNYMQAMKKFQSYHVYDNIFKE